MGGSVSRVGGRDYRSRPIQKNISRKPGVTGKEIEMNVTTSTPDVTTIDQRAYDSEGYELGYSNRTLFDNKIEGTYSHFETRGSGYSQYEVGFFFSKLEDGTTVFVKEHECNSYGPIGGYHIATYVPISECEDLIADWINREFSEDEEDNMGYLIPQFVEQLGKLKA